MSRIFLITMISIFVASCTPEEKIWTLERTIDLKDITPIGIVSDGENLWVSDGDHNRMVKIDSMGNELEAYDDLERPMHIDYHNGSIYFPEYGSDSIKTIKNGEIGYTQIADSLDAPAGISILGSEKAVADFYSHRVFYYNEAKRLEIGGEGKEKGQFYYPTDVQITPDRIWVADAYNNRVQSFDKEGNFVSVIGELDDINAATGIFVQDETLYVTDFENSRILMFDFIGNVEQEITEGVTKPTDIMISKDKLYVANYKGKSISIYTLE